MPKFRTRILAWFEAGAAVAAAPAAPWGEKSFHRATDGQRWPSFR